MSWKDIINRTFNRGSHAFDLYSTEMDIRKEDLKEQAEAVHAEIVDPKRAVVDYFPVQSGLKIPSRQRQVSIQTVSDYYLYRMEKYWETDGIVFRAINKLVELVMQSGFVIESRDQQSDISKFRTELASLMNATTRKYTERSCLRRILHDTILYGNGFVRKKIETNGRLMNMIFTDPLAISVVINKDKDELMYYGVKRMMRRRGDIEKHLAQASQGSYRRRYAQYAPRIFYTPEKADVRLSLEEVNHIKYLDIPQSIITIPPMYTTLNDVLSLRAVEDDMSLLSFQYGHPLLHASIDSSEMTEPELMAESAFLKGKIQEMEGNGLLVTSHRVKVELKGPQGNFPDLVNFHTLFRQRIEKGAGVPDIFTGEGGGVGRQTSETVERSMYAFVNDVGHTVADQMQTLFTEIFNRNVIGASRDGSNVLDEAPVVVRFKESDRLEKRAEEQHAITLWQSSAIPHEELRVRLGQPVEPELKGKYFHDIQSEQNESQLLLSAQVRGNGQQSGNGSGGSAAAQARKTRSVLNPQNQKGTAPRAGSKKD